MTRKANSIDGSFASPRVTPEVAARGLLHRANRGLLLDLVIFLGNLFVLRALARLFFGFTEDAEAGDVLARVALLVFFFAMLVLPVAGAILKRRPLHQRLQAEGHTLPIKESLLGFFLFNPVVYLIMNMLITATVVIMFTELLYGRQSGRGEGLGVSLILVGFGLNITQTVVVYRYLSAPKHSPRFQFLASSRSEGLGDTLVFLNMILFQIFWNWVAMTGFEHEMGIRSLGERAVVWAVLALFVYFPPRIFYLAEDIKRPRTWLTMLLANSPLILHVLFGGGSTTGHH